ncbi:MAG: tetratricopeptide repeat protein, partial [Chitinispirillia bacterium]
MLKFRNHIIKILQKVVLLNLLAGFIISLFADGLPGEYYVTQRWRDLLAGHSPATNPAFMTEENYITGRVAICPTLHNSFLLMEMGVIIPIGLYQSVGLSYMGLTATDDIPVTKFNPDSREIDSTGEVMNDMHYMLLASYAINPWNRLSIGVNLNLFSETNFGDARIGGTIDLALSYRLLRHSLLGDHIAGICLQNLISPDFDLKDMTTYSVNFKISWLAKIWEKQIEFGVDLDIKDFLAQASEFTEDATKQIEFDFNTRFGVWILRMINAYFQFGSDYWGLTGGLNIPTVNKGRDFQVAYQYMSIIDDEPLTSSHTMYFRGDFGLHREEIYARKMARLASVGPGNLYNIARTHYSKGRFWDAFFVFGKILIEYPDFFKNDRVQLFLSLCQENLDMKEIATENFHRTKQDFPRSDVVPLADLGLLRLHYRDENYEAVANQYAKINSSSAPDSVKYHAYYYMGETHLRQGAYNKAIELFDLIPGDHPEYPFAQHSLAIASISADNPERAVQALDNVIQLTPKTKAQEEIINRSFVFIGYIYYEGIGTEKAPGKAVSALRKVSPNSYYYEDALLGIAWTALKASQWADCIEASKKLASVTKRDVIKAEAGLLEGYCYLLDKSYDAAVDVLRSASQTINNVQAPSEEEKNKAKMEYE